MGLDQYVFIAKAELEEDYYEILGEKDEDGFYDIEDILNEIAYFRKSNWLHGYMDRLCESRTGHYIEDCEYFVFNQMDLKILINTCENVLVTKSKELAENYLPPQEGFFFGPTDIDEYYFEDLQNFIKKMKPYEEDDLQFVYYAWW